MQIVHWTCEISFQSGFFVLSSVGHMKFHFNISFFALSLVGYVKFCLKSVQITLNYIMLKRKLNLRIKQKAKKLSVSLMEHHRLVT